MSKSSQFEQAIADLEALVTRMESGELPLSEAMKEFQKGIALVRACQSQLEQAKAQVAQLLQEDDTTTESGET